MKADSIASFLTMTEVCVFWKAGVGWEANWIASFLAMTKVGV
jgi:hypothetical protein